MLNKVLITGVALALAAMLAASGGCAQAQRRTETRTDDPGAAPAAAQQTPVPAETAAAPAADAAKPDDKAAKRDEVKSKRKELRGKERRIAELQRNLKLARLRLDKTHLTAEQAEQRNAANLEKAEAELDLARRRLTVYNERDVPSRLAWNELSLQGAEDGAREAQEEIEQLEKMYADDEFADQTKEIVLERGRRRLQRSLRDLALRRADAQTLQEHTIPTERSERERALRDAEESLKRTQEGIASEPIDRQIELISAEGEIAKIAADIEVAQEELQETREAVAKLEKELEASQSAAEPQE